MATPTNAQLGKLLATYLSTSNDALAIHFRKYYSPTFSAPSFQKAKTKRTNAAVTEATFIYRHAPKHAARIVTLYQHLLKAQWIAPDTNPDDFCAIFEGNPSTARIKRIGKQAFLYYLIRQLVDLQLISIPQNASVWKIVESHFLNKNSRPFHNFNKQKEPIKAKAAIDKLIEIDRRAHV